MGHKLTDALQWHIDNGIDVVIGDAPVNRLIPPVPPKMAENRAAAPEQGNKPATTAPLLSPAPVPVPAGFAANRNKAIDAARACTTLEELREAIRAYDGLDVKRTATNLVFADGNPQARVMVIGEAPGADEDRQGLPFVGVSGQLLDKMFDCIGLNRANPDPKHALYISNILNWRPPGNRTPTENEIALAMPFIERHIAIVKPAFLILAGAVAAQALLNSTLSISKLRGKAYDYKFVTPDIQAGLEAPTQPTKVIPTYHPSFLLRTPVQKRKAWQDLLLIAEQLK